MNTHRRLKRFLPSGSSRQWPAAAPAIVVAEALLRLRDTNMPLLLACMAGACILMTPSADANYAIITFSGMKPLMSAGASIVAAGTVFSLLVLPIYLLGLGVGCSRDRQRNTGVLLATSPVHSGTVIAARMLSNALLITMVSLLVLILVVLVIASRSGSLPNAVSVAAYLLIVIPSGLCSVPLSAVLDRLLLDRYVARAWLAIALWLTIVTAAMIAWPDIFGFLVLKHNRPAGLPDSDMSLGIIGSENMATVAWQSITLSAELVAGRLWIALGAAVAALVVIPLATPGFMRVLSDRPRYERTAISAAAPSAPALELRRVKPAAISPLRCAILLSARWLDGRRWAWALIAASVVASMAFPASPRLALTAALFTPLLIANARRISSEPRIQQLELSLAAWWRPSPWLFMAFVLAALIALPCTFVLSALPAVRSIHLLVGVSALALWLVWTCAGIAKPMLGISIYVLVWYVSIFCEMPAQADLLGIGGTAAPSLGITLSACLILGFLLHRRNRYDYRSTQRAL